jgi:flagellar protein FlbD
VFILLSRGHFYSQDAGGAGENPNRGGRMIQLTRLNGEAFVMNAEKIRYVEQTPDTIICSDTGEKLMVRESLAEVMRKAIEYARLIRRPITD